MIFQYRVRPGFTFGAYRQYGAGDIVELTEAEAAGFADKLELVDEAAEAAAAAEAERAKAEEANVWRDLPDHLVELLINSGYLSLDSAQEAQDDVLLAINGIGPSALQQIREA